MNIYDLLKGKKVMVETDMKTMVELEIKEVTENRHSQDLEPATSANDWWPKSRDWTTYTVKFTNGAVKEYQSLEELKFH